MIVDYLKRRTKYFLIPEILALLTLPVIWAAFFDRTPPVVRLHGTLIPSSVVRGEDVRVRFVTKKRTRPDCAGTVQQEIIDNNNTIFSKLGRATGPALWEPDPENPDQEIFIGQPVNIPAETAPGPAIFRTVTFRYCNWFQRNWPGNTWPIVQIGPDIEFNIQCQSGYQEVWEGRRSACVLIGVMR